MIQIELCLIVKSNENVIFCKGNGHLYVVPLARSQSAECCTSVVKVVREDATSGSGLGIDGNMCLGKTSCFGCTSGTAVKALTNNVNHLMLRDGNLLTGGVQWIGSTAANTPSGIAVVDTLAIGSAIDS